MKPLIKLSNISLTLRSDAGKINVLKNINLDIPYGQTISVVGPSGAGKTSLIMLIAGLEKPTSGEIVVNGNRIDNLSEDELAIFRRKNIGIIFQNFHLIPTMTALENVMVPLEFAGVANPEKEAINALSLVGLENRILHFPSQLSGGEQQRVAIARAFAAKPKIILADEPTGNLDSETGKIVMDELFDLNKKFGTTFVLITHDPKVAKRCKIHMKILDGEIHESNN